MVLPCGCQHEFQDERYGVGMRVHNLVPKQQGPDFWRCTVCCNEKRGPEEKKAEKSRKPRKKASKRNTDDCDKKESQDSHA